MSKKVVGVMFGGRSGEHEVSLKSAQSVMKTLLESNAYDVLPMGITKEGEWFCGSHAMKELIDRADPGLLDGAASVDRNAIVFGDFPTVSSSPLPTPDIIKLIDVVFPVLHGPGGEDGTVQGMLTIARVPFVGCNTLASSVAMDKIVFKNVMRAHDIPVLPDVTVLRSEWESDRNFILSKIESTLSYPVFCKPANMGSSVGISKCRDRAELTVGIDLASRFDRRILVELAAPKPREIEVSVLGNDQPIASIPGEIVPKREFYDYTAKYIDSGAAASDLLIPAPIGEPEAHIIRDIAVRAFRAIDGSGMARVDFFIDRITGDLYLNELNTIPGFTAISMYSKLWAATGIPYPELIDKLIELAVERFEETQRNQVSYM
ncbi:MAG: D-alanine--D-alanine ligase family protein [bacterium]